MRLVELKGKWLSYYRDISLVTLVTFVLYARWKLESQFVHSEAYYNFPGFNGG